MEYFFKLEEFLRFLHKNPEYKPYAILGALVALALAGWLAFVFRRHLSFVAKSLLRNPLRTGLTSLAIMVLVFVVSLVWSFLVVLDVVMTEKSKDLKAIVTERWQLPSQMPFAYHAGLEDGAASRPGDVHPEDHMTWQFYGGTFDPTKMTPENFMFAFAMDPRKLRSMMDDLEELDPIGEQKLIDKKDGILIGLDKLKAMNKRIGERCKLTSFTYKGIDLEFEIVGTFPDGRYNNSAVMNRDYLNDALDAYPRTHNGDKHPMANRTLNLVWLRVPDTAAFQRVAEQIMTSSEFTVPAVKCETASSGIASFLDPYRDLLWGLKWLLMPAIVITMAMILANAISISVRERLTEMAVLKVLGFGPGRILAMVLGEAVLIGASSGLASAGLTYVLVHHVMGGIKFPIAFFPLFDVYADALWWGVVVGALTALAGSLLPAWSARTVKVSEVFSKVA
jgi:putative ABC transport system permease protein